MKYIPRKITTKEQAYKTIKKISTLKDSDQEQYEDCCFCFGLMMAEAITTPMTKIAHELEKIGKFKPERMEFGIDPETNKAYIKVKCSVMGMEYRIGEWNDKEESDEDCI